MHRFYYLMITFCLLIGSENLSQAQQLIKDFPDFEKHTFKNEVGSIPYRLLKPIQYDENKTYPLVIFFHGAGERGSDNVTPLGHIADLFLNGPNRRKYPCFVLVPQCPQDTRWVDTDWTLDSHEIPEEPSQTLHLAHDLLQQTIDTFQIDTSRVYVTGLSMGGFAVWDIIARYPDLFAAAIPICGGGDVNTVDAIKSIPIWAFHGKQDRVVKPDRSRNMIMALRQSGAKPKYTEYPNIAHGSWKPAYEESNLLGWLFAQKK